MRVAVLRYIHCTVYSSTLVHLYQYCAHTLNLLYVYSTIALRQQKQQCCINGLSIFFERSACIFNSNYDCPIPKLPPQKKKEIKSTNIENMASADGDGNDEKCCCLSFVPMELRGDNTTHNDCTRKVLSNDEI